MLDESIVECQRRREVISRLVRQIIDLAHANWGPAILVHGWERFSYHDATVGDVSRHWPIFEPWFVFGFTPSEEGLAEEFGYPAEWPFTTLAQVWLESDGASASAADRELVRLAGLSPWSLLAVEDPRPGGSLDVRDLMTGRSFVIVDPDVASAAHVDDIIVSAVLTMDGVSTLLGAAPHLLPPAWRVYALDTRRDILGDGGQWISRADLAGDFDRIFEAHRKAFTPYEGPLSLLHRVGGEYAPFHLCWRVDLPFMTAIERLQSMTSAFGDDWNINFDHTPEGDPLAFLPWYVHGNDANDVDDCLNVGYLFVDGGEHCRVTADVPTQALADVVTEELAGRLGDVARLVESRRSGLVTAV